MRKMRTLTIVCLLVILMTVSGCQTNKAAEETVPVRQGLLSENGGIYYYNEDGTSFTGGYKEITAESGTDYYYFLPNGRAFSTGYKSVEIGGVPYCFFFEEDGKAFTGGLKEVTIGGNVHTYYFGENGRALTCCWEAVDGCLYYFGENGRAARNTFQTIDGSLYYFDDQFATVTSGWFCLDAEGAWYYAGEDGKLATDTVIDGYRLDAEGKCSTKYRIREFVAQHTQEAMTQQEKIDALYNWVLSSDMTYIRSYEHVKSDWVWKDSWVDDMAASLMDNWGGNCFRYGAFMGMLIREATGLPVSVSIGDTMALSGGLTPHCWVNVLQEDIWYVYDVEMQKFANVPELNCYRVPAEDSFLHLNGNPTPLYSQ